MVITRVGACPFPARSWRRAAVVSCAILALAGCSSVARDTVGNGATASPHSARSIEDAGVEQSTDSSSGGGPKAQCELLTAREVAELAGEDLGEPRFGSVAGLPGCVWGSFSGVAVQVSSMPVTTWAEHLPGLLDQVEDSPLLNDPMNRRKLAKARRVLRTGELSPDTGCDLFSLLLEIQGQPAGRFRTVNLLPGKQNPQAMSAQMCSRGTYTSVGVFRPGLSLAARRVSLIASVMLRAHARSIG